LRRLLDGYLVKSVFYTQREVQTRTGLRGIEWTRMLECGVGASCRPRGIVVLLHHLIVTPLLVHSAALPFVTYPCALTRFN